MQTDIRPIDSKERMIEAIRELGIVPFFRSGIRGWSIEDFTAPGCWFGDEENGGQLGPWDWKIDAIREGDIAYGKYIRNKAAFATEHWYRHLMNWRRSIPKYRMAIGEEYPCRTLDDRLNSLLSPVLLSAVNEFGSLESAEIRAILQERCDISVLKQIGGSMEKYLIPAVKKQAVAFLLQYLDMGTWTVVGDFTRIYRGANLEYSGWQRSSVTTPDALFGKSEPDGGQPFWAKFVDSDNDGSTLPDCSPEESRELIMEKVRSRFPDADRKTLLKLI